jgi:hypothetical protein
MAKFITTAEISALIEKTIKESQDFIILASPYIKIHSRLKKIIEHKLNNSNVPISFICRNEIPNDESSWLKELKDEIKIVFANNLHAKSYLNENHAIITSMNLYEYSMINNIEFGVYFDKILHNESYCELIHEMLNIGLKKDNFCKRREKLKPILFNQLLKDTGATRFEFEKDINGDERLCLMKGDLKVCSIKIGSEIMSKSKIDSEEERVKKLITKYKVYFTEGFTKKNYQFTLIN